MSQDNVQVFRRSFYKQPSTRDHYSLDYRPLKFDSNEFTPKNTIEKIYTFRPPKQYSWKLKSNENEAIRIEDEKMNESIANSMVNSNKEFHVKTKLNN